MLLAFAAFFALLNVGAADLPLHVDCVNTNLCVNVPLDAEVWSTTKNVTEFLWDYNCNGSRVYCDMVTAQFNFQMNETDETSKKYSEAQNRQAKFDQEMAEMVEIENYTSTDPMEMRQLEKIKAVYKLDLHDSLQRSKIIQNMTLDFNGATVCNYTMQKDCWKYNVSDAQVHWQIDPTLDDIMASSDNYDLLQYIWEEWRKAIGQKIRHHDFPAYVSLSNKGAKSSGYPDMGAFWRSNYVTTNFTDSDFQHEVERLWLQVLPLYEELHAYVRHKVRNHYMDLGYDLGQRSTIPAHILGNMWAQQWNNILRIARPYKGHNIDVTPEMVKQNYTAVKIFEVAKDFFQSIGLPGYNKRFMNDSIIVNPRSVDPSDHRVVECYSDSEDFYNGADFGMTTCTKIRMEDLITIHHEMGHINYFMEYSHQPLKFRDGANSGFHEAIGDTMALSATTVDHLEKIRLLKNSTVPKNITEQDINFLFNMALQKIAFLPFGYLIDQYRWKVFDGTVTEENYQEKWWDMRYQYQGIYPPGGKSWTKDETLFDPGAKFHVDADVPYVRYFVSFIIQFQFHEALCKAAGFNETTDFLHRCDIYQNQTAGDLLKSVLTLGASKPWPDAMEMFTGTRHMDASKLMLYFQPLVDYLKQENAKNNVCYGWGHDWPGANGLNPKRCHVNFPDEPLFAEFTDSGMAWNESLANHSSSEYLTAATKYETDINHVFSDEKAYRIEVTVTDLREVEHNTETINEILDTAMSRVGVVFTLKVMSGDQDVLPKESKVVDDFQSGIKKRGYNYTDFEVSNSAITSTTPTTPAPTASTASHPSSSASTSAPSKSTAKTTTTKSSGGGGSGVAKKISIAALVVSCVVLVAVVIILIAIFMGKRTPENTYSTLQDGGYPMRESPTNAA